MSDIIYTVVAPLALVRRTNGTMEYCYRGAPVPQDAAPGEVKRLEAEGYIVGDVTVAVPAGGIVAVPVDGEGRPLNGAVLDPADPGLLNTTVPSAITTAPALMPGPADRPRGNASEAAWREYHAAQLVTAGEDPEAARAAADSLSRDDIRARYPSS